MNGLTLPGKNYLALAITAMIVSCLFFSYAVTPAAAAGATTNFFEGWSWDESKQPLQPLPGQNAAGTISLTPVVVPTPPYSTDNPQARGLYLGSCPIGTGNAPQLRQTALSSGAQCRGACGIDCPPERCKPVADITIPFEGGTCTYRNVISCPSHYGCRDHDACYDICTERLGDSSLLFGTCHGICNQRCYDEWNYPDCIIWAALPGVLSSSASGKLDSSAAPVFDRSLIFSDPPEFKPSPASLPQNNITMLHYTGTQYFSTHVSNAELDCDDQAAGARLWTQDPYCGELHMTGISGTVWCDKPDAPCIDTASHNGIRREASYYITTSTDSSGTVFVNRVADGPDRTYAADGTITSQTINTDGKLTELCKIDEKSGGKKYNCRDAIGVQYTKMTL